MQEIIFSAHDYASLLNEAEALGFTSIDADKNVVITTNGVFENGGWFLNVVGTIYEPISSVSDAAPAPREGYWGRLRINGTPAKMPTFSSNITQYIYQSGSAKSVGKWIDAATGNSAPDWVADIGIIA